MDVSEIRTAFFQGAARSDRARAFRHERVALIKAENEGDLPQVMPRGAQVVLHFLPFGAFNEEMRVDLRGLEKRDWDDSGTFGYHRYSHRRSRFNYEGFLIEEISNIEKDGYHLHGYLQIFRNGAIESVYVPRRDNYLDNSFEAHVIRRVQAFSKIAQSLGCVTPIAVALMLRRVRNFVVIAPPQFAGSAPHDIDRDELMLSECIIQDWDTSAVTLLKPAFDSLWQSVGLPQSPSYNDLGEWIGVPLNFHKPDSY